MADTIPEIWRRLTSAVPVLRLSQSASWKRIAALWLVSFGALVTWSRAGVLLHETAGHALVWWMQGGSVVEVEVFLFGGGYVRTAGTPAEGSSRFLFEMSGIFVNAALGVALGVPVLAALVRRRSGGPERTPTVLWHFLAWGAVLNVVGATHYAAVGSFYGHGDAGAYPGVWRPATVLLIITTPAGMLLWARTFLPLARVPGTSVESAGAVRLGLAGLLAAVVPLVAYAGALSVEQATTQRRTEFVTLRAEKVAIARAVEEKRRERLQEWRRLHGDEPVPPGLLAVGEDEVERPFPFLALVIVLDALFLAAVVLAPRRPGADGGGTRLLPAQLLWPTGVAAVSLAVCGFVF